MSDDMMYRSNTSTEELLHEKLQQWAKAISTPEHVVKPHFIRIKADAIKNEKDRQSFDKIPTNFSLNKKQVDLLANTGRTLLKNSLDYQQLVTELDGSTGRKQ